MVRTCRHYGMTAWINGHVVRLLCVVLEKQEQTVVRYKWYLSIGYFRVQMYRKSLRACEQVLTLAPNHPEALAFAELLRQDVRGTWYLWQERCLMASCMCTCHIIVTMRPHDGMK